MNKTQLTQLIRQSQKDPDFFHALVFNPEQVIEKIKGIDASTRQAILRSEPSTLLKNITGIDKTIFNIPDINAGCGGDVTCSCTSGTCGDTCGGSTCSVTCSGDSCGSTCGDSCGYTTNLQFGGNWRFQQGVR